MNLRILALIFITLAILGSSCNIFDKEEPLPMFIKVEQPSVILDARGLTSDLGVKDLWIDRGADFLGIYEPGQVIPVFPGESDRFLLTGGIFNSGLSGFRRKYPFWRSVEQTIPFSALDTVTVRPTLRYFARDTALEYVFEEDFETGGRSLVDRAGSDPNVIFQRSAISVFEGSQAGRAVFNSRDTVMDIVSERDFTLPATGQKSIWLEVRFKSDIPFAAGLFYEEVGQGNFGPIGGDILYKSDDWTTVFIPLTDPVRGLAGANLRYRVWFRADGQRESGTLYLDYIRLIHFV